MLRKLTLSLMILLSLFGISSADFIYTTTEGTLGAIRFTSTSEFEQSPEYVSNISSPLLTAYWNGTGTGIMLLDRYATASGDRAYIFNPSSLGTFTESKDIDGVYGTSYAGYSENGYSLFLASGSEVYEVNTSTFRILNSYDCTNVISQDGYTTEICSLAVDTSLIHVLAKAGDKTKYMRFDGQLKKEGVSAFLSADVSAGASLVLSTTNNLLVCHSSGIDRLERNGKFNRVLSTDYPVKAICKDANDGFFYAEQSQDGGKYTNMIYHSQENSLFTTMSIESSSPNIKLLRDNSQNDTFAVMTDEAITIFTFKNGVTATWDFSASSLGGTPGGIVTASVSGYDANKRGSSGCNSVCTWLVMLAVIPFVMKRK